MAHPTIRVTGCGRGSGAIPEGRPARGAATDPSALDVGAAPGTPDADWCLSVDIGGTKFAAAVVDRRGQVQTAVRAPTPPGADAEQLWSLLESLIAPLLRSGSGISVCGVGCGGPMDLDGEHVSPLNIPGWRSFPLRRRLAERCAVPVFVDNDAKALTLAEGWLGAARGVEHYMAMVVSTGIGGGIVLDGRLLQGRLGNAGHVGHVIVAPGGRRCGCGGRGCLEAEASGTAIAEMTGRPASEASPDIVERTGALVGVGIASVANLLDLALVVVGGSVALGFGAPFFQAAQRAVTCNARMPYATGTRVVPVGLGPEAPLIGAAAVGWRGLSSEVAASGPERRRQ